MARNTIGARQHVAVFSRHNGTLDESGNPTYGNDADWVAINVGWPCEMVAFSGGETMRGRMVSADKSHVLFGWWGSDSQVLPSDRVTVKGGTYQIVSILEADGDNMTGRVKIKRDV